MADEVLTQGTVEYLLVDVTDLLGNLESLDGTDPTFDVINSNSDPMITGALAQTNKLRAFCLIDTNSPILWPEDQYRLYIQFTTTPEIPRLGPFRFTVDVT